MNQTRDVGVNQEAYLERLLQQQHQLCQRQNLQKSLTNGDKSGEINGNNNSCIANQNKRAEKPSFSGNATLPGLNGTNSSSIGMSNNPMGLGINQQHQNCIFAILQEQQQLVSTGLVCAPSDLTCNLTISGLSNNVGLGPRLAGLDCGSIRPALPSSTWMDGFGGGGCSLGAGHVRGTGNGGSLYSTEQDLLSNSNRYPTLGGTVGSNQLTNNSGSNGSLGGMSLNSSMGGLSRFSIQHQALAQASLNSQQKVSEKSFTDLIFAKQAQVNFLEATKAQISRTTRLPCGARGMKADHNSSTAYFDIPEKARHGQHLLCSHSVCRTSGVKFRYCFYCKKPVTKQNFRSRHLHADLDPNKKKDDKKRMNSNTEDKKKKMEPEHNKNSKSSKSSKRTTKKPSITPLEENSLKRSTNAVFPTLPVVKDEKEICCSSTEECLERPSKISKLLDSNMEARRWRWIELLEERPSDDLEAIHCWTGKVLSVSNPAMDTSIWSDVELLLKRKQQDQNFDLDNASSQRLSGRWNSLLDQRPKGDSDKSSITKWLIRALEVSDTYKRVKS